jgi:hypothetical protein
LIVPIGTYNMALKGEQKSTYESLWPKIDLCSIISKHEINLITLDIHQGKLFGVCKLYAIVLTYIAYPALRCFLHHHINFTFRNITNIY